MTLSGSPLEASLDARKASQFDGRNSEPEHPVSELCTRIDLYRVNGYSNKEVVTLAETQGHAKCIR